jgi:DNA polymerase III sliding clamp (beta) subunit (PCNA family)
MTTITLKIKDIKAVSHAMGNKDLRYYLNGVLVEHNGIETRLVATDGHRLHGVRIEHDNALLSEPVGYIIPRDFVMQLLKTKFSKKDEKQVTLTFSEDKVSVTLPNGNSIISKLIDGKFVDYRKAIPKTFSGEYAYLNPQYQLDAVNGLNDYSENKNIVIKIQHNGDGAAILAYGNYIALIMPVMTNYAPLSDNPYAEWTSSMAVPESTESVTLPAGFEHDQSAVDNMQAVAA